MKKNLFKIVGKNQKIVFEKSKVGFDFQFWVKKDKWRPVTAKNNFLIWGSSFDLSPQSIKKQGPKKLSLKGKKPAYSWQGEVSLLASGWFRFDLELDLPKKMKLFHEKEPEPQILFKLPTVPVQEEGGIIWNQVLIPNPALDNQGIQASDLPAVYYFDPQTNAEMMVFLDWGSFNWASNENIFGFLGGRCELKTILKRGKDRPLREKFLGFWPQNQDYLGKNFSKGKQRFRFYFFAQAFDYQPDEWEGLTRLIKKLAPLLKDNKKTVQKDFSWGSFARNCLSEIVNKKKIAQVEFQDGALGLRAYGQIGDFRSPNPTNKVELMTQVDLLWPLIFYLHFYPSKKIKSFFNRLFCLLPCFFDPDFQFLRNWYPQGKKLFPHDMESWYFLENGLVKFGWIALLTDDTDLKKIFLSFSEKIIQVAHQNRYLFPLRFDWQSGKNVGGRKNFIAAGLYSAGMCLAFEISQAQVFLKEAIASLETIHQLPLDLLFHEPQQLGFAAATAFCLFEKTNTEKYKIWAWEFLAQQLRMFYWYTDLELKKSIGCDCAGMVRSFPSKIYPVVKQNPAFKENVESILPWTVLLKDADFAQPLLEFLNLVRVNNFYFFDSFQKTKNPSFIPLEALPALLESGSRHRGGGVGHAVYGAGEIIWLYLLFESLSQASDKKILVVCLDFLKPQKIENFGCEQNFLIYNPTSQKRRFALKFKKPPKGSAREKSFELTSGEYKYVRIDSSA